MFEGKAGLEIGGPSRIFSSSGSFPVYPIVGSLDNCNFDKATVWDGAVSSGRTFLFDSGKSAGIQYIAEATDLAHFESNSYDFVLASHILEHVANPILALNEWKRLLKDAGVLVLVLPDKRFTFDHRRPVTTMSHLLEDFQNDVHEDDLTHLSEILDLHDLRRDPEAGNLEAFKTRSLRNFEHRCMHHHVFDSSLAESLMNYLSLEICTMGEIAPHHIFFVVKKVAR